MKSCLLTLGLTALVAVGLNFNIWASGVQKAFGVKERVVEKLYLEDSPVVVADLKVSGETIKFGDRFDENKDWLLDLSVIPSMLLMKICSSCSLLSQRLLAHCL